MLYNKACNILSKGEYYMPEIDLQIEKVKISFMQKLNYH